MPSLNFDVDGARKAGYTDTQIADVLASKANFDSAGARAAGFKDTDIIARLTTPAAPVAPKVEAEDPGVVGAAVIGAGRTFDRVGKGMKQIYLGLRGDQKGLADLKAQAAEDDKIYAGLQELHPIATGIGEAAPSMVIPVGTTGTALATAAKLGASGAIPAALEYGSVEDRAKAALAGGAGAVIGGQVIPKAVGAVVQGGKNALRGLAGTVTPEALALAAKAEAMGIKVNAAQLGDSKLLKTLASSLEQMPFTGAAQASSAQRGAFTRAVSKTFGDDVDKITPEIYAANRTRLGAQFDDLAMRNTLNIDNTLTGRLNAILDEARQFGDDSTIRAVNNAYDRLMKQSTTGGKLYHSGTYKVGDDINNVLYAASHPDDVASYVTMATERGMKNVKTSNFNADLKLPAPESVVRAEAKKIGIDPDAGTPASVFDSELHGPEAVKALVSNLKKIGYDHAVLGDIPYGAGKQFNSTVIFPGVKTSQSATNALELPGAAYSSLDRELGNIIKGGGEKGNYLKQMQLAIREAMDRSINPEDKALWDQTRTQYKNLKAVRNIVSRDGGDGNIPPAQLLNALNSTEAGKEAMAMGNRGTLGELGRIGKQFVKDSVPNSGTAQRAVAMGLIGGGGFAFGASPAEVAGMLAGGATAGKLVNKILMSPKVIESLSKQGLTVKDLMKLPPATITQIIGGASGMAAAEGMRN